MMTPSNANSRQRVALVICAVLAVQALLQLWPGYLAINGHEVDAIHAVTAAIRVADGAQQHIDFVSPLGVLTFLPAAMFIKVGFGAGLAFILSQLLVALILAPMIWYAATSRLTGLAAPFFAAISIIMITALVYGGDNATVSISMFYNRWAWVAYFLVVMLTMLPRNGRDRVLEGVVIALCLSMLVLLKATYFLTLVPVVGIWLIMKRDARLIGTVVTVGLGCLILSTLAFGGVDFWVSYVENLRLVATSDVRPAPGKGLGEIVASPAFFAGTQCLLAAIVGLRMGGRKSEGLLLLLLSPGFIYITYQNWGNDPKWLILLGFLALGWRFLAIGAPFGVPARGYFAGLALACFAVSTPTILNLTMSSVRHAGSDRAAHVTIAADPRHDDLLIERDRSFDGQAMMTIPVAGEENGEPLMFAGVEVGGCTQKFGYFGKMAEISSVLKDAGMEMCWSLLST